MRKELQAIGRIEKFDMHCSETARSEDMLKIYLRPFVILRGTKQLMGFHEPYDTRITMKMVMV